MASTSAPAVRGAASESDYVWIAQVCPICEIKPTKFLGYRGGSAHRQQLGVRCEVWSCGRCGLNFPNPMPFPKGGLDQHYDVDPSNYFAAHVADRKRAHCHKLLAEAERILGRRGRLLDVGAGRGEMLSAARERGWTAVGLEPSPTFAREARLRSECEVYETPIEESNFAVGSFDAVMLAAILEHLYHPQAAIAAISRILKPGGALYVEVPNERGLFYRAGHFYHRLRRTGWTVHLSPTFSPYHVYGFSPRPLKMLLRKHKLEPRVWRVFGGSNATPRLQTRWGGIEQAASSIVVGLSNIGPLGNYIETWAIRQD